MKVYFNIYDQLSFYFIKNIFHDIFVIFEFIKFRQHNFDEKN